MKSLRMLAVGVALAMTAGSAYATDGTFANSWLPSNGVNVDGADESASAHYLNGEIANQKKHDVYKTTNYYNQAIGVQNNQNTSIQGDHNNVTGSLTGSSSHDDIRNTGVNAGNNGSIGQ